MEAEGVDRDGQDAQPPGGSQGAARPGAPRRCSDLGSLDGSTHHSTLDSSGQDTSTTMGCTQAKRPAWWRNILITRISTACGLCSLSGACSTPLLMGHPLSGARCGRWGGAGGGGPCGGRPSSTWTCGAARACCARCWSSRRRAASPAPTTSPASSPPRCRSAPCPLSRNPSRRAAQTSRLRLQCICGWTASAAQMSSNSPQATKLRTPKPA